MKTALFSNALFCGLVVGELTVRELRTAFENSRDGINRYLNDNFQFLPYEHLTEFDEFTSIGSKLDSKNSRILPKNIPGALSLFKKLNIRALLYDYSKMQDDFEFQYQGFDRQESCRAQHGSHQIPTQKMTTTTTIPSTTTETISTTTADLETFSSNPDYYQSTTEPNTVALEPFNYDDLNIDMEELMDLFNGLTATSPPVTGKDERSKPIKMTSGGSSRIFGKFIEDAPVLKSAFSAPKIELPKKPSATSPTTPKTPTTPFIPSEPKCCGDYPNMKLYNPDRRKCCDGRIRSLGSC
ncbi:Oidioi.mRNA.OKI2018_I69.chr2.g4404.t1.cds [Oikopleura dioica]|uniref:Oidioi.mRNA.OKI2018_I69.chr2.g4404.t1.cds n=1 Tax=Oikopleura dioica TaxID=34765 RepID=A0ABN7SWY8_OIKDI|nr:Oidioi.mRNA.OKI2018_I69.chr2.g4404.t1.cds [Oikopleura dioica]